MAKRTKLPDSIEDEPGMAERFQRGLIMRRPVSGTVAASRSSVKYIIAEAICRRAEE